MNKKLSLLLIACLLISMTACNKKASPAYKFNTKTAVEEREDGWLYFFNYEYTKTDKFYIFNGYNLKYKHIDGYDIPIIDSKTGKIIDILTSSLPSLALNQKIKPDIDAVECFFSKKQFVTPIKISDLDNLNLNKIHKEDILRLFNLAIGKNDLDNGKYSYLPEADIVQETLLSGYQWQVGFFISHGNILKVRIELIYNGSKYLSDIIDNKKADEFQKNIYKSIKEIENKIINDQSFNITMDKELTINNIQFKRLYTLLQKIESGGYKD